VGPLALMFVGAVLFVNGLAVLGRVDPRAAAPINFFVGVTLVVATGWTIWGVRDLSTTANLDVVIGASGFLLFAFTYLYVGIGNLAGHSAEGLGWYCAWAALISVALAITNYTRLDDPKFGMLWVLWAILFTCFFVVLGLGRDRLGWATGWVTVIEAFITTTIPGGLLLLGKWDDIPDWVATAVGLSAIAIFVLLMLRRPTRDDVPEVREAPPVAGQVAGAS
jgi:hypothetical protein